ncbi:MAG: ACT domain-containing protein [Clostridia bacterium]|nr:ACT domain-containing protein [Clostridia bacterium]
MGVKSNRIVITVVGIDKVGIIAGVTSVLAKYNANIVDISQTIMQEFFTMIMIVDIAQCTVDFSELKQLLDQCAQELQVKITAQHEDVFRYMHRI